MKNIGIMAAMAALLAGCYAFTEQQKPDIGVYRWYSTLEVPRNNSGEQTGDPYWEPTKRKSDTKDRTKKITDTVFFSKTNDSIPNTEGINFGVPYKKIVVPAETWKPKPSYGDVLFLLGTYSLNRPKVDGVYVSLYTTKDRSSLLQILYTNPGNIMIAWMISKDSVNILKERNIVIDPRVEGQELTEIMAE